MGVDVEFGLKSAEYVSKAFKRGLGTYVKSTKISCADLLGVQRYTNIPVNHDSLQMDIVSQYTFGCTGTQAFPMCLKPVFI